MKPEYHIYGGAWFNYNSNEVVKPNTVYLKCKYHATEYSITVCDNDGFRVVINYGS